MAAAKKYPHGLITGRIWDPLRPSKQPLDPLFAPKTDFTETDVEALRPQLQLNLMPKVSKSNATVVFIQMSIAFFRQTSSEYEKCDDTKQIDGRTAPRTDDSSNLACLNTIALLIY